jgi:integrase
MQPYNPPPISEWGWGFMEIGQVCDRKRNGRAEYWVEVWWGNPKQRYTFTQIPIPGPNGIEWHSCSSDKSRAEFLLHIIRGRIKDNIFHPEEFRKQSPMQFDVYARKWLEIKKPNVGTGHYDVMKWAIERYLIPQLNNAYLLNISKNRLRELQNNLTGKNKALSLKSKRNIMDTLLWMLRDACPEYISRVPDFPGFKGNESIIPRDIRVPEINTIFNIIEKVPEEHRHIFWFMIFTGCRPSEARAFRKEDIEAKFIMFVKTFDGVDNLVPVKGKKPKPFPRTKSLNHILSRVPANLTPQVFINPSTGKHYTSHEVTNLWRASYTHEGFGYLKMYDCTRHAFATMMREGGMDLADIKDLMRHANMKTTEIYDHSSITRLTPMIDKILPFPGGSTAGKPLANKKEPANSLKRKGD